VALQEVTPEREPVAQGLNYILSALDIICGMAVKPETADEVAAEKVRLGQILSRVQLLLSFIDPPKKSVSGPLRIRVMQ
jgi:hypothetical protein